MKIGDLVECRISWTDSWKEGLVVGFGLKGEGGKDYVYVLIDCGIEVFMWFNVVVIKTNGA